MKMAKPTSPDTRARRQQAEQKLREQRALAEQPASELDARALVHELEVHQIELEMQNEGLRRAAAQAQNAVEKYTELFDFAPLGYFQLTQDGVIREANLAGAALLGLDRSRVVSRRFGVWVAPACLQTFATFCETVLAADTKQTCEIQLLREGQEARDVQLEGLAAPDQAGLEKTLRLAALDIIGRKRAEVALERSERLYRAIGESIDYGVWICEPDGRNIYASPSFLKLVGITQEQCSNFGWGDVLRPEDAARTIAAWKECVRTGGTWDIEHRFRGVDGQWHPILARGLPVRDEQGTVTCWAGINLDISRLKQAEAEIRRRAEELRAANEELTRFNEAMVGRELRMIELKQEVNALCAQLGQPLRYPSDFEQEPSPASDSP
jgi:PAS domain S-box-containing protein